MSKYGWVVYTWLALAIASCVTTEDDGSAEFLATTTQSLSAASVSTVTVRITGSGIDSPITYKLVQSQGTWKGTIQAIPAGPDRTFQADARDATNAVVYSGSVSGVTISKGQTTVVALLLQQVNAPPPFMNTVPQIDSLVASSNEAVPDGSISISIGAHDPDATDVLSYAWSATGGTFSATTASNTSWTAPDQEGPYTLTIRVTDTKGSTAALSFSVVVRGRGAAAVTTTFNTWPQVVSLTASPTRLDVNDTTTISLGVIDNDGDATTVAWSTTCAGSFSSTVAANPQFQLSALSPTGSCSLNVSVSDGRGGTTTGTLSIQTGPAVPPNHGPVVDSAFQSDTSAGAFASVTFAITAHDPEGTAVTTTWSTNSGAVSVSTVTGPGASTVVWTAPACFDPAVTPTITATMVDASGASNTYSFLVSPLAGSTCVVDPACSIVTLPTLLAIRVTPPVANTTDSGQTQLVATGYYADAPTVGVDITSSVTWASDESNVVSVSSSGLASWTGSAGTAVVSASIGAVSGAAQMRVWSATRLASVTSLAISGIPGHISSGSCYQATVTATFNGNSADTEDVTRTAMWTSGGRYKVIGEGFFAAIGGGGEGYYNISASLVAGGVTGTQQLGIWGPIYGAACADPRVPGPLWGLSVSPSSSTLFVGQAQTFSASGIYSDGSVRDISTNVSWGSCQPALLDVTPDAWAVARATGSASLIVSQGTVVKRAAITVTNAPSLGSLSALRIAPRAANVTAGATPRFLALGTYSGAPSALVDVSPHASWTSSDPDIVTVNAGRGTTQQLGLATVSASFGSFSSSANARVWDASRLASITSIGIGIPNGNISGGYCQQLSTIATFNNDPNDTMNLHDSTIWSTTNGTIDNSGFWISAPTNGYVLITASLGRGILSPVAAEVGVWGGGGTCP